MAPATLYTRTGGPVSPLTTEILVKNSDTDSGHTNVLSPQTPLPQELKKQQSHSGRQHQFPPPTLLQRAYLKGILYKPQDAVFLVRLLVMAVWAMIRLHSIELPYLILSRFKYSSMQHPLGWKWWWTIIMGLVRSVGPQIRTIGQLRFLGLFIEGFLPLQVLFIRRVKVYRNVQLKVNLDILLRPERASLAQLRQVLKDRGYSDDPVNPSQEYLASMHLPAVGPHARLSNMPDEVGQLDKDGSFTLKGEWIEATADKNDPRPRSTTVILYFHGGAHAFLSPASHREFLCRLAKDVGPGTRVFSVDYRMAPEHPFPAAVHDAFAAYLYLTEPTHEALTLNAKKSMQPFVPVDPRDIVVAGDSAGGGVAVALMLYLAKYVQPSMSPKYVMPHATILLSAWTDPTSSLPAANSNDWYCYCPGPIGTKPFDKAAYMNFSKMNFASNYLTGDVNTVPNPRNALGKDRQWEWYQHLAQHPLVAPVHRANVSELSNTLLHTGTHDRLVDDNRLFAHRLGLANPKKLTRIENYQDQIHVHHVFPLLEPARLASRNIARFIERSRRARDVEEGLLSEEESERMDRTLDKAMIHMKSADNVEWVTVDRQGKEETKDEGWPMNILLRAWPPNEARVI